MNRPPRLPITPAAYAMLASLDAESWSAVLPLVPALMPRPGGRKYRISKTEMFTSEQMRAHRNFNRRWRREIARKER